MNKMIIAMVIFSTTSVFAKPSLEKDLKYIEDRDLCGEVLKIEAVSDSASVFIKNIYGENVMFEMQASPIQAAILASNQEKLICYNKSDKEIIQIKKNLV